MLKSDAARPEAHNALGILYSMQGHADEARQQFERALAIDPDDAVVLNNLGNSLRDLARPEPAATAYRRAIELAPTTPSRSTGWARCWWRRVGRPRRCRCSIARSTLAPDRHEVRLNRAVALELVG